MAAPAQAVWPTFRRNESPFCSQPAVTSLAELDDVRIESRRRPDGLNVRRHDRHRNLDHALAGHSIFGRDRGQGGQSGGTAVSIAVIVARAAGADSHLEIGVVIAVAVIDSAAAPVACVASAATASILLPPAVEAEFAIAGGVARVSAPGAGEGRPPAGRGAARNADPARGLAAGGQRRRAGRRPRHWPRRGLRSSRRPASPRRRKRRPPAVSK